MDLLIGFPFVLLYVFAVNAIVSRMYQRDAYGQRSLHLSFLVIYISVVTSFVGVMLGEAWSGVAEMIRLGNGHLSYRTDRNPWSHHYPVLFLGGLVLFWCIFCVRLHSKRRLTSVHEEILPTLFREPKQY